MSYVLSKWILWNINLAWNRNTTTSWWYPYFRLNFEKTLLLFISCSVSSIGIEWHSQKMTWFNHHMSTHILILFCFSFGTITMELITSIDSLTGLIINAHNFLSFSTFFVNLNGIWQTGWAIGFIDVSTFSLIWWPFSTATDLNHPRT